MAWGARPGLKRPFLGEDGRIILGLNGLGSPSGIETASPGPPQHPANVRPLEHGL